MNFGIDLGSSRIVICDPLHGVVLDEPSVIAVNSDNGKVIACGDEAERMLGRTPPSINAVRPVRNGVIADYALTEKMLQYFLHRVCSNRIAKPCAAVSIAEDLTEVERRSFIEAVISAGARRVTLVPETVAAAIGADLDVSLPIGQMIVNIGGGTIDAAVLSLRGTAVAESTRSACMAMDDAIVRYLRVRRDLIISEQMAESLREGVGGALPRPETMMMTAKGRDALTGLPRCCDVSSDEMHAATREVVDEMVSVILRVLEITPPELSGDIMEHGMCLTGGGAQMYGMAEFITLKTGIQCRVADNPAQCVAIGAARALQYSSSFSEVYDLGDFSYHLSDTVTN